MRNFNFVVERDPDTGLFVGYVPGWPGAHSQGDSRDELPRNPSGKVLKWVLREPYWVGHQRRVAGA